MKRHRGLPRHSEMGAASSMARRRNKFPGQVVAGKDPGSGCDDPVLASDGEQRRGRPPQGRSRTIASRCCGLAGL
jgi:hypothetical protein